MRHYTSNHRRRSRGFSITELLVSISLVVLLIGITYPFISAVTTGSRVEAGLNIVGMSADVARQWVQAESWANDGSTTAPTRESYSGTAAIYCPTREIRIVKNDRRAQDTGGNYLEDTGDSVNGYSDLSQVDYILIPDGVGVAGIERFGNGANDVRFIAPPFAVAFNELGQLNYGDGGLIYYDADDNGAYDLAEGRGGTYNPSEWNGERAAGETDPDGTSNYTASQSLTLPFEAIECVPGVVIYSTQEFTEAGFDFDGGGRALATDAEGQWLIENGETIFFSPHTGVALRDEQE